LPRLCRRPLLAGLTLLLAFTRTGRAQSPAGEKPSSPPAFRVDTGVVMLDVVVRDKKGRLVRDLRPEEVQVFEDGVKQEVTGFRFVETGREAVPPGPGAPAAPAKRESEQVTLVTLLFDQLGNEARIIARKAALDFLDADHRAGLWISVFAIDRRMHLLQQFTTNRDQVRAAVEVATGAAYSGRTDLTAESARVGREGTSAAAAVDASASAGAVSGAEAGSAGAASGAAARDAAFARIEQNAVDMTDQLERQLQGESSIFGLLALANQQQKLAGRKTIVYFSEGLQVTSRLEQVFHSAVSEANRANVSIYAVDARGLGTQDQLVGQQEKMRRAVRAVQRQMTSRGGVAVTREEVEAGETAEESLRVNTQGTLGDLAESTGGFLIANSNDMKAGMEKVAGDIVGYYEVVYAPAKVEADGKFREVSVKLSRGGTSVQARKGYFAVPAGEGTVTFPYEMALLGALRADPTPHDFDFRASALRYGRVGESQQYTLMMEVPLAAFSFKKDGGSYRAHFSFMAVLRHPTQGVVQKFSQDSPVEVPGDRKEALTRGNAIFTRSFTLAPGRYTLETVAQDQGTKKTSVRKAVLVVTKATPTVGLSSLAIIKRTEPVNPGALETDDALRVGQTRIVPELGEPILNAGDGLPLFLVAYPARGATEKPELTVTLLLEGQVVARSTPDLPTPDDKGRIAYIATIPCTGLAAGRYEVRVHLRQGAAGAEETTFFNIGAPAAASAEPPPGKGR
jgi:VWFA-related protein